MGAMNNKMFSPSNKKQQFKDHWSDWDFIATGSTNKDIDEMTKEPEAVKPPPLPDPAAQIDSSAGLETGEEEIRRRKRGYGGTMITGSLAPKTKKGKTALG